MTKSMFNDIFDREMLPFIDEIQQNNGLVRKKDIEVCKEEIFSEYNVLREDLKGKIFGDKNRAERIIREFPKLPSVKTSTLDCYDSVVFNLSQIKTEKIGLEHFDVYSYSMFFFMLENYYNKQAA